jgi:hypothetical protein
VIHQADEARRRAAIQSSLEQARSAFQEVLGSLTEDDLAQKRSGSGWCAREVATHVVTSIERVPPLIAALRQGEDYMNYPLAVLERLKRLHTWWVARDATWGTMARRLDAAYPPILALVETIRADEWGRSGGAYGEGHWTVEHALLHQLEHVKEHIRQIRELIKHP